MDAVSILLAGLLVSFLVGVLLLGLFSQRPMREVLHWQPTRSPEVEAQNELDDVAQMIEAQNAMKRRRGAVEVTEEEMRARVREDRDALRRWRES